MKQYNEKEVLKAIAGSYQPGFLQIKLTHSFDGGLGQAHIKTPGKTSAGQAVRRLALWAERYQKIASLHPLRSCIQSILFHL